MYVTSRPALVERVSIGTVFTVITGVEIDVRDSGSPAEASLYCPRRNHLQSGSKQQVEDDENRE